MERIIINQEMSWSHLSGLVASKSGTPLFVVGRGSRARRLIFRLGKQFPNVWLHNSAGWAYFLNERIDHWAAMVGPDEMPPGFVFQARLH